MTTTTLPAPATSVPVKPRKKRYTSDQVSLSRLLWRMLAGLVVALFFILPYLIMFFGSVKTQAQIRSVTPTYFPTEWHWENYLTMWSTPETPLFHNLVSTIVISVCAT